MLFNPNGINYGQRFYFRDTVCDHSIQVALPKTCNNNIKKINYLLYKKKLNERHCSLNCSRKGNKHRKDNWAIVHRVKLDASGHGLVVWRKEMNL